MPSQIREVVQYLRSTVRRYEESGLTDGQLLERFIEHRDHAAVTALVQRHGPMVWGVCCRILQNHHDAEDAFQAAFLVLVRRAGSVRQRAAVGNWLYGVAHQTALKARTMRAKRRTRERQVTDVPETEAPHQEIWRDLHAVLDHELSRLPDKYRVAIVLCDVEGATRKEAARQLGLPEGTLAGRLTRGRALLAKRLARYGLTVSGGALATVLSQQAASASVPASVLCSTIQAVTSIAAGQAAAGVVSAKVAALSEGMVQAMLLSKIKIATAVLFVMATLGAAMAIRTIDGQTQAGEPEATALVRGSKKGADAPKGSPPPETRKPKADNEAIQGLWKVVAWEFDGWRQSTKDFVGVRITGGKIFIKQIGENVDEYIYKLDETHKPKHTDWVFTSAEVTGRVVQGIYHLDGDHLVYCMDGSPQKRNRPTEFRTEPGDGRWLLVLERERPAVPPEGGEKTTGKADPFQGEPKVATAIQGNWHLSALERDGEQQAVFARRSLLIGADQIVIDDAFAPRKKYWYVLHPEVEPKQIDLIHTFGVKEGKVIKGIYRLEGDRLFLCMNYSDDGKRPAKFATEAGTKVELTLLEREKKATPIDEKPNATPENRERSTAGELERRTEFKQGDVTYTLPFPLPSADEILKAVPAKDRPKNAHIECELIRYQVNDPRTYPGAGKARLVNAHFRFIVLDRVSGKSVVGYIDKDHLIPEQ